MKAMNHRSPQSPGGLEFGSRGAAVAAVLVLSGCMSRPPVDDFPQDSFPDPEPLAVNDGAIYRTGNDVPLFENATAHRVGDVVTIHLVEATSASKSSSTSTSKKTSIAIPSPTIIGKPVTIKGNEIFDTSVDSSNGFDGKGDSAQ